jgi:trimeric autotransporter adhesin
LKTIPALIATALVLALIFTPLVAHAAGSITFSSPASGSAYKGTQAYTITGVINPAPGVADSAFITVKNPSGQTVDATSASASPSTGSFTYNTATGGSSNWVTGTYTITATDSYGATGSTTFTYTAVGGTTTSGLVFQAQASSLVLQGDTAMVSALVVQNGTPVSGANFTGSWLWAPGATTPTALGSPTAGPAGTYEWSVPVSSSAKAGLYAVYLGLTLGGSTTWTQTGFTVTTSVGSASGLASVNTAIAGLATTLGQVQSTLGSINTAVGGLSTAQTNMQTTLGNINTAVQSLSGLSDQLKTATSGISSTQTYVLVVAVLAAITLVLELAILVRKLS